MYDQLLKVYGKFVDQKSVDQGKKHVKVFSLIDNILELIEKFTIHEKNVLLIKYENFMNQYKLDCQINEEYKSNLVAKTKIFEENILKVSEMQLIIKESQQKIKDVEKNTNETLSTCNIMMGRIPKIFLSQNDDSNPLDSIAERVSGMERFKYFIAKDIENVKVRMKRNIY